MAAQLTPKQLGKRIMNTRKQRDYSQEELSKLIGISRPSLVQIELGNRAVSAFELHKLSEVLQFSMDEFLATDFRLWTVIEFEEKKEPMEKANLERVSIPKLNLKRFKNVLLYILEQCSGKPNVGETMLYKLLYFSDFNFYELYEEHLTGANYRKLQFGPVPHNIESVLEQMRLDKEIQVIKTVHHGFTQKRYISNVRANLKDISAAEVEVIDHVIDQFADWTASKISEYSHKDMPWKATPDGEFIDYELALYRETPFSVRNYEDE